MKPLDHIAALAALHADDPEKADGFRMIVEAFENISRQRPVPGFTPDITSWPDVVGLLAKLVIRSTNELAVAERSLVAVSLLLNLRSAELQLRRPRRKP